VVSWGVSLQPPSTLVQLLLAGSDFCPGGRTPNPPGKSSTALQGFFQTYIAGTGNKFHPPPEILTPGNVCWCKFLNVVPRALADTAVFFLRAFVKNVAARCDFRAQNTPKCVCFARTPWDRGTKLTDLPVGETAKIGSEGPKIKAEGR